MIFVVHTNRIDLLPLAEKGENIIKTTQEFFDRLENEKAFNEQVMSAFEKKLKAGEKDRIENMREVASEFGYEFELEEAKEIIQHCCDVLSDEELSKVSGGDLIFVPAIVGIAMVVSIVTITDNPED